MITIGNHVLRVYSTTKCVIALSSAESEFYATTKAGMESTGMIAMLSDFGVTKKVVLEVDASAALGVIERRGIGKIRHLQTCALWLQEQELRRTIRFKKTPVSEKLADLFTKHVPRHTCEIHINGLGCTFEEGRVQCAARLHAVNLRHDMAEKCRSSIGACNKSHEFDDVDWTGTEDMNTDQMTEYVDQTFENKCMQIKSHWSSNTTTEMLCSVSDISCTRCQQRGHCHEWRDHWSTDLMSPGMIVRHQSRPRTSLFTPCGVRDTPCKVTMMQRKRVTIGTDLDGESFMGDDDWSDISDAHRPTKREWTGFTILRRLEDGDATVCLESACTAKAK